MRLRKRIEKLERTNGNVYIALSDKDHLTGEEQEVIAQEYRRANGLPPESVVIVFSARDVGL